MTVTSYSAPKLKLKFLENGLFATQIQLQAIIKKNNCVHKSCSFIALQHNKKHQNTHHTHTHTHPVLRPFSRFTWVGRVPPYPSPPQATILGILPSKTHNFHVILHNLHPSLFRSSSWSCSLHL